jgi:kynurenine formamidase
LVEALGRIGRTPAPGDIVMLWTGGTDRFDDDPHFPEAASGLDKPALEYMFEQGVRVMTTDSATIDRPITWMTEQLVERGAKDSYFPIHRAGRWKDWTHAEKLGHMGDLPGPFGFKVVVFPIKIAGATGAWTRAAAIDDDWLMDRPVRLVDLSLPLMNSSFEPQRTSVVLRDHDLQARAKAKQLRWPVGEAPHSSAMDEVDASTHAGTHVDAPRHFGPGARSIDQVPLDWVYGDAVLIDANEGQRITLSEVRGTLDRLGYTLTPGTIVLFRTGAADSFADDPRFSERGATLDPQALCWLLDAGVRALGCDAESLEGPTAPMLERLRAGRPEEFFPLHYAGRDRPFCFIEKMDLSGLSHPTGFKLAAFPIKLEGGGAAWTRAVAFVEP